MNALDKHIPVKRLQLDHKSGTLVESPAGEPFLRGPIPLAWLSSAARQPGKTLNVAVALMWLHGMTRGKPFKLTQRALNWFHVSRDAARHGLACLERHGLIRVEPKAGRRPMISVLDQQSPRQERPPSTVCPRQDLSDQTHI